MDKKFAKTRHGSEMNKKGQKFDRNRSKLNNMDPKLV